MALEIIKKHIEETADETIQSLPEQDILTDLEKHHIIARYTAVLETNFIAWMTATHVSVSSQVAQSITKQNLIEEFRDNHPGMMRKFAICAESIPTEADYNAVREVVDEVRKFVGKLCGLELLIMMAFFENFIARFMPYLAKLAQARHSTEFQYTDVHGEVDIEHTQGLYRAIESELGILGSEMRTEAELFEGINRIRNLISVIITTQ